MTYIVNRHLQIFAAFTAALVLAGLFSSCPMQAEADAGTLAVRLPGGAGERALTDPEKASLHYTVTLTSSLGQIVTAEGSAGQTISIDGLLPGDWTVEVSGYLPDKEFAGYGFNQLTIASGKNRTQVSMHEVVTDLASLKQAIIDAPSGSTLVIGDDIPISSSIAIGKAITLKSAGNYTLSRTGVYKDEFFEVSSSGGSLTLAADGKNTLTLDGGSTSEKTADNALIIIADGSLELGRGTILQNNKTSSKGGALSIEGSNIEVTISGAIIRGNYASSASYGYGGAIYNKGNGCKVIINDGRIYNNQAHQYGGAIYLENGGHLIFNGGHICGNHVNMNDGGGIGGGGGYSLSGSSSAEVKGNTATNLNNPSNQQGFAGGDSPGYKIGGWRGDNDSCSEGYSWP